MLFLMFTILADLDYDLQITVFARAAFSVVQTILQHLSLSSWRVSASLG